MTNENYIKLPRGSFFMGTDDEKARDQEKSRHEVIIVMFGNGV